jgi:hypothetical protein
MRKGRMWEKGGARVRRKGRVGGMGEGKRDGFVVKGFDY